MGEHHQEVVLEPARAEIRKAWRETCALNRDHPRASELFDPERMPGLHDPFAGGGTIPLEAQRLGLEAHASDLNPVAVLINKAMIEIPPKFAGRPPVHPDVPKHDRDGGWKGAAGLAEDVRRYGKWMRDEAFKQIGHLYPPIEVTEEMAKDRPDLEQYIGEKLTVIAWLWARTVKSPNPTFSDIEVPLISNFILSSKEGKEAYVQPVVDRGGYAFTVKAGEPPADARGGTTAGKRAAFRCLMSNAPISYDYIRLEGQAGRMRSKLMAIVVEGRKGRAYLSPSIEIEHAATSVNPTWKPDLELPNNPRDFKTPNYGMRNFGDLFTARQLVTLTTLSDLVRDARTKIGQDAVNAGMPTDGLALNESGLGAIAYAEAIEVYLAIALSRFSDRTNSLCTWDCGPIGTRSTTGGSARTASVSHLFTRQSIPMAWDYAEANPFSDSGGSYSSSIDWIIPAVAQLAGRVPAEVRNLDAGKQELSINKVVATDPPYYDNIGYADLSDFFYVWLRRSLRHVFPDLFATLAVPKADELVATPYRHGGRDKAEAFFLEGMTRAMRRIANQIHPAFPVSLYYAFKQSEKASGLDASSTGWVSFLESMMRAGLAINGTWPMRTELGHRMIGIGTNALASSIILVCRPRMANVGTISRRQFVRQLNEALPLALDAMTRQSEGQPSPVAPVDLSQAIIGPGMAIFSRYDAVLEADGTPMTVKTALQLINRFLAEDDFDADTQFCLHWFEQHGWEAGKFGEADTLARAKGTSVAGVTVAGVVESGGGQVRLLRWREYSPDWDPRTDSRLPVWEALHQLIRAHNAHGDAGAARVLAGVTSKAEAARQLAYRLYTLCERSGRAEDARAYNEVVTGWSGIESAAVKIPGPRQGTLFE